MATYDYTHIVITSPKCTGDCVEMFRRILNLLSILFKYECCKLLLCFVRIISNRGLSILGCFSWSKSNLDICTASTGFFPSTHVCALSQFVNHYKSTVEMKYPQVALQYVHFPNEMRNLLAKSTWCVI